MQGNFPVYVWNRAREEWVGIRDPYSLYVCVDWRQVVRQEDRTIGRRLYQLLKVKGAKTWFALPLENNVNESPPRYN